MAMPTDYWRNDQMLNIFRTKPCQRLARDGVCGWRSQCQFSHSLEWPRRQPRRYNYSPELCPHIRLVDDAGDGPQRIENNCSAGLRCPWAHSKEEVLFHPHLFKTCLCEEHTSNAGGNQKSRSAKKNRCHRYYCPFAHGHDELRTSPLPAEQRERCLLGMEVFPSDVCCVVCTRHWLTPPVNQKAQEAGALEFGFDAQAPFVFGAQKAPAPPMGQHACDVLSTVPNRVPHHLGYNGLEPHKDPMFSRKMMPESKDMVLPFQKPGPTENLFSALYQPDLNPSLFYGEPLTALRELNLTHDAPAYIDLAGNGGVGQSTVGQRPERPSPTKSEQSQNERDLLGEFYYAML